MAKPKPLPKADIKALLVTGGCCHDYGNQREIIPASIDSTTGLKIEWTIHHQRTEDGYTMMDLYKNPNWADGYDIVVHNECYAHVSDFDFVESVLKPHREGVPAMLIHCSMHSYRETGAEHWWEFCGLHSPGHGPKHPFEVKIVNKEHEITQGMENWTTPDGELYFIKKAYPTMTPLTESLSEKNGEMHTNIWVNAYGPNETRVFGTTIGHHNETMLEDSYMEMITRGFLWAVGKPVAENLNN